MKFGTYLEHRDDSFYDSLLWLVTQMVYFWVDPMGNHMPCFLSIVKSSNIWEYQDKYIIGLVVEPAL